MITIKDIKTIAVVILITFNLSAVFHFLNVDIISGGGNTVSSNQMLRNSDLFTGTVPAEYGNAVSGVFDIKMRYGNSENREFAEGIGTSGIDFMKSHHAPA